MTISRRDFDLLNGLYRGGHAFLAASEFDDAQRLLGEKLIKTWSTESGFLAWRLTSAGKHRIESAIKNHEAIT